MLPFSLLRQIDFFVTFSYFYFTTFSRICKGVFRGAHKTIFTAKKDGREIYIIARPSDYDEVILYYDAEIDTLDYTKDFELWIEDGKTEPQKLTFGRILRLTGINRIPLRRIR